MSIEAFITIHDSSLISECESTGRFQHVDHTYLFVGPREVTVDGVKVIRCVDYDPNYEHLPHFYDFTGWFVLAKHNLIHTDKAVFLQYDHFIHAEDLAMQTAEMLEQHPMVGYVPAHYPLWTLGLPGFYDQQMQAIHKCGADWNQLLAARPFELWPSTQGTAWRTEAFNEFMLWFEPAFEQFQGQSYAGHLAERMIQPFLMTKGWEAGYLPGLVAHESLDCHGTRDLIMGNTSQYEVKNQVFGR